MKKLTPKWPSLLGATSHVAAKGYSLAVPVCHTLKSGIWVDICSFSLFVLWYNYYVLVSVCKRCTRRCDCCNPELVCDSQQVQLQILKKQCVFFLYCHNPRDDHMECTWNLGFLNEEHSRVSKIKPGKKKIRFLHSSCHLNIYLIYVELWKLPLSPNQEAIISVQTAHSRDLCSGDLFPGLQVSLTSCPLRQYQTF